MSEPTEVISFKMDKKAAKKLRGIQNRSEFIRNAILSALDDACPFCKGTGVLAAHRKKHWEKLAEHLEISECKSCHEMTYVLSEGNGA